MREIISISTPPRLAFSGTGQLKLLRTGSDSTAEHNNAAEHLLPKLCTAYSADADLTEVHPVTQGQLVEFIDLPVADGALAEAVIGLNGVDSMWFRGTEHRPLDHPFVLSNVTSFHDNVAAALAWGNFAIRVRGPARVDALAEFHAAVQAGDAVLAAGTRFNGNPHGVVLINLKALTVDERKLLEHDPGTYLRTSFAA